MNCIFFFYTHTYGDKHRQVSIADDALTRPGAYLYNRLPWLSYWNGKAHPI